MAETSAFELSGMRPGSHVARLVSPLRSFPSPVIRWCGLFAAERNHRIDPGSEPRREVACQQCHRKKHHGNRCEC